MLKSILVFFLQISGADQGLRITESPNSLPVFKELHEIEEKLSALEYSVLGIPRSATEYKSGMKV